MTEQQQQDEQGYAEGWKPKPKDRIVGTVVDIAATDMGYGIYPIVTVKTASGEVSVHAFHTVLRRELARRKPKIGDQLDITYLGKKSDGGGYGKGYDMYTVRSDKDTAGYDWDRELLSDDARGDRPDDVPIDPQPVPVAQPATPAPASDTAEEPDEDLPF